MMYYDDDGGNWTLEELMAMDPEDWKNFLEELKSPENLYDPEGELQ